MRSPVFELNLSPFLSQGTATRARQLNSRIADHNAAVEDLAQRRAAARSDVELADIDFKRLDKSTDRLLDIQNLQTELRLRREWNEIEESVHAEMGEAYTDACGDVDALVADVKGRTVTAGFLPIGDDGTPVVGCCPLVVIQNHPEVRAAREKSATLLSQMNDRSQRHANDDQIERLERELTRRRDLALGLPPAAPISPFVEAGSRV